MGTAALNFENEKPELERVVISGARGALGGTLVDGFRSADCTVVGFDIDLDREGDVLFADPDREEVYWSRVDMSDPESVGRGVAAVEAELGSIDAVINCAGGFRWSRIENLTDEDLDFLMEANLRSALLLTREVLPGMREHGYGRIVLMSTRSTLNPGVGEGPYAATKSGLNALTKSVASEVAEEDITINAILPSTLDTPDNREAMADADFSKWVRREQIAEIVFRLTQSFGDPINGALLPVSGKM